MVEVFGEGHQTPTHHLGTTGAAHVINELLFSTCKLDMKLKFEYDFTCVAPSFQCRHCNSRLHWRQFSRSNVDFHDQQFQIWPVCYLIIIFLSLNSF